MLKQVQHDVRPYTLVFQTFFRLSFIVIRSKLITHRSKLYILPIEGEQDLQRID